MSTIPALCSLWGEWGEGGPFAIPHPLCAKWPGSHKVWSHLSWERSSSQEAPGGVWGGGSDGRKSSLG